MAASDKPFNNQRTLDIVFAVSNILMLLSVVWMLWDDHFREWKVEQRLFRNVEVAVAQRAALDSLPTLDEFNEAKKKVEDGRKLRADKDSDLKTAQAKLIELRPAREKADQHFQTVKSDVESFTSLLYIAIEHGDKSMEDKYRALLADRGPKLDQAQQDRDKIVDEMKLQQLKIEQIDGSLTKALAAFKKVNDRFDTQVKLAQNKRWGFGDWFRALPVIDGFASPLKIQQFTIETIPIDYNFKKVTRFDRCMTCHQGIDKPGFTRENLMSLTKEDVHKKKLEDAEELYKERIKVLDPKDAAAVPNPSSLSLVPVAESNLTAGRVTEFCAHPRLDLFVGSNSKHPAEKFGCTSCHSGQGSGTAFADASHSPNSMTANKSWTKEHGWEFNHMWDFPMLPKRFVESSCLKCHHEVTDLRSSDNRNEAPKLLEGHHLIRENGCFGCHEISGWKGGQRIGPDMRLEPNPPLEEPYSDPTEIERAKNDPDNRPGALRKVGPALTRVSEKVSEDWIKKWLSSPSAFRPDTKMPHYYGLTNNDPKYLPEDQKKFPDTEMTSIAYFLTKTSKDYLQKANEQHEKDAKNPKASDQDQKLLIEMLNKGRLTKEEQDEFNDLKKRIRYRREIPLVDKAEGYAGDADKGRVLFTEKGCLACHTHAATETASAALKLPEITSAAVFGPNLTQVAAKFGDKAKARKWLIQWILDPHVHSPRSRMPVTHLTPHEAADVAAWLLAQPMPADNKDAWEKTAVKEPTNDDLKSLARVYLTRMLSNSDMDRFFKGISEEDRQKLRDKKPLSDNAVTLMLNDIGDDEKNLLISDVTKDDSLKFFLGKKAVSRLGCFACHDIPGFETAKPIGVALNDWGKKPADRLAFEDINNFYKAHYRTVESLVDKDGKPEGIKDGKEPYEAFYAEALTGHYPQREGYLNQKIRDPRSYDYNRIRAWDDRSRMPKFTLARPRKHSDEDDDAFKGRIFKEEAQAREAVATFVLGLVAEQVPTKSVNQPTGDRMAEVKGRQVLDKYNCNGCHLIRPGVYDFKPGVKSMEELEFKHSFEKKQMEKGGEIPYLNHINWVGRSANGGDRLRVYGSNPAYEDGGVNLMLNEAIRFVDKDKKAVNIPAGTRLNLQVEDFEGAPKGLKSQEDFDRRFASSAPFGGTFANLMAPWLVQRDKQRFPAEADARGSLPPSLVGQGERTQPDWLYNFLLNPHPVRRLSILRMPKFNMSKEEAKTLMEYFAAVTRQTNSGIGLSPLETIPGRDDTGEYWRNKTLEYIKLLKDTKEKDQNGKEVGSLFDARIKAYKPVWQRIRQEAEPGLKAKQKELDASAEKKTAEKDALQKNLADLKDTKDPKDLAIKADLEKDLASLSSTLGAIADEKKQTETALADLDEENQQKRWETEDAYAADAYRMLTSRELCTKCHQVGNIVASATDPTAKQGPPLNLAFDRLRPDWIERWVDKPQRFVPYQSLMIAYFDKNELKYQDLHAGPAQEQIRALRDALLNYPRLSRMPINRIHNPDRK
jgi:cbb3-type cytochrome oxidase cytochrome c subunit